MQIRSLVPMSGAMVWAACRRAGCGLLRWTARCPPWGTEQAAFSTPPTSSVTADSSPVKMCRVPDSATLPTTRHFAERGISALQREKSRKKWATQSARPKSETAASVPIDPANKSVSPSQVRDRSRQVTGCRERGQPPQPQPSKASLFGQAQSSAAARPGDRTPGEQGDT